MAGGGGSDGEFGLQIAPMLDILFVLLLFFMVSAGAQKHEASIATQLPGNQPPPGGVVPVEVTIDSVGQVSINTAPLDTPNDSQLVETINRLKAIVASNANQPVIISPMASTRQQRVVDVLNACTAAGVKNLAFGSTSQ
jgi:biopolymer transport protein ExbD